MLALFGNIAPLELAVIAALAVIIFGKRLPEVAARAYATLRRVRMKLEDLRRETGIDTELREIERSVRDAARRASLEHLDRPAPASGLEPLPKSQPTFPREARPADGAPDGPPGGAAADERDAGHEPREPREDGPAPPGPGAGEAR